MPRPCRRTASRTGPTRMQATPLLIGQRPGCIRLQVAIPLSASVAMLLQHPQLLFAFHLPMPRPCRRTASRTGPTRMQATPLLIGQRPGCIRLQVAIPLSASVAMLLQHPQPLFARAGPEWCPPAVPRPCHRTASRMGPTRMQVIP